MLERAVIDGVGRLTGRSYFELVRDDHLGIDLGAITPELRGRAVREFLPAQPLCSAARAPHRRADRSDHRGGCREPVADGLPETLEDYLERDGIGYLKIKVGGALEADLARLEAIAAVLERRERRCGITLDGNEQYQTLDDFMALVERIKEAPGLRRLWDQVLFIEQPLDRAVAMAPAVEPALRALGRDKPVIIDEADGWVSAFKEAIRSAIAASRTRTARASTSRCTTWRLRRCTTPAAAAPSCSSRPRT